MRIVAVADTHLFHGDLVVPDGDVFVHAGDMCRGGSMKELREAAAWIRSLPHRHKIVVAGNHDWGLAPCLHEEWLCRSCLARDRGTPSSKTHPRVKCADDASAARALFESMMYLEDAEAIIDGVRFWGSPWQPEFHGWAFNLPRGEALAAVWRKIPRGIDVLITHGPPAGIGDRSPYSERAGCADLRARIAEITPRLHLFGHIHQDGGLWREGATVFANVTTWECERAPTVIDLAPSEVTAVAVPPPVRSARGEHA